jgi:exonuclease SbcD
MPFRFLHISDLHIGKNLCGYPLLEDQRFIFEELFDIIRREKPDAVLIAGDIYDKYSPSPEATNCLDEFLTALAATETPALIISGNHDSPELLNYASRFLQKSGVHIAGVYNGEIPELVHSDEYGEIVFHLLPFVRPGTVRRFFPDEKISTHEDAVRAALSAVPTDDGRRHVLLAHQYFTSGGEGGERSDSEIVGALDNVDAALVERFDYVALGHLHKAQRVGSRGNVYYAGSPLKYSAGEWAHNTGVNMVTFGDPASAENRVLVERLPLTPLHDVVRVRGTLDELTQAVSAPDVDKDAFVYAVLTDKDEQIDAYDKLLSRYPRLLTMKFENLGLNSAVLDKSDDGDVSPDDNISLFALFQALFKWRNNRDMTPEEENEIRARLENSEALS